MDEGLTGTRAVEPAPHRVADLVPPEELRLEMPDQVLWPQRRGRVSAPRPVRIARAVLVATWAFATGAFAWTLYRVLSVEQPTILQWVFLLLSTVCFAWVAVGSVSALIGFAVLLWQRDRDRRGPPSTPQLPRGRTALLFPIYREDASAVAANIETIAGELAAAGAADVFRVFILSDTQDPTERAREGCVFDRLRAKAPLPVYVRWRSPNAAKKAGNIRDWIERFGAGYPTFVILDADSLMTAECLLRLAAAMEAHPEAGLIQSVPHLVGGHSLFAQLQQFAAGYYGPIIAAGLAAWHGPGGNYWGHNAIIRTKAFATSAGLPELPGRPPRGGLIMSHDFVEAALLRRAGWEVHMLPSLEGSFEGCPPSLSDLITRDRRWAQGNLQHLRLLRVPGVPVLSRIHLLMGACSYLASPVWALTLLVGVILAVQAKYATPTYFGSEVSLFPKWPVFDAQKALALFFATVLTVHLPKLLGAAWALRNRTQRLRNGGVMRVLCGVLVESVLSTLIAPVLMLTQTSAVTSILMGRDAGWMPQQRVGAGAALGRFVHQHRWHMGWGLAAAAVCWAISAAVFAWMSPIIIGLLLAAPIAHRTARPAPQALARLLANEAERQPPRLLLRRTSIAQHWRE
jgi:membrane glycosyltransferase